MYINNNISKVTYKCFSHIIPNYIPWNKINPDLPQKTAVIN